MYPAGERKFTERKRSTDRKRQAREQAGLAGVALAEGWHELELSSS